MPTRKKFKGFPTNLLRDFGRRKYLHVQGMSKQTSFARWAHDQGQRDGAAMRSLNKQWVHPPEALLRGHIVYNVKFLGEVDVDQPKGTEVVRDAIRKMKFSKQIRKAEGQKVSKVELTISADGVTVQDPKTKVMMYQYPLHRISYCADDKADKRMFTFIAKVTDSTKHLCYVFDSEKCAEEITLTVGQAFDLAYRRFLESSGKDMDTKKQFLLMQKKVQTLQQENEALKKRITELEKLKDLTEVEVHKQTNKITLVSMVPPSGGGEGLSLFQQPFLPQQPARVEAPVVGRKLENLIFEDNFTPTPQTNGSVPLNNNKIAGPVLSPPPPITKPRSASSSVLMGSPSQPAAPPRANDAFGASPFSPASAQSDPFGMGAFKPSSQDIDQEIHKVNQELMDLQAAFSQGLSFGTEDFSLDDLDPLKAK